jgi:glutathione S-transferase
VKLYITQTSPYARVVRLVIIEKGLAQRVEIVEAKTRMPGSPYYALNPSGRVPFLVRDDGPGLEGSGLIATYLDNLDGRPALTPQPSAYGWAYGRLEAYARSMLDGIAVWVREMRRPDGERSPPVLAHEIARAGRLADFWEREIGHAAMQGPPNLAQFLLVAAIEVAAHAGMGEYDKGRPKLAIWLRRMQERPSIKATAPPPAN